MRIYRIEYSVVDTDSDVPVVTTHQEFAASDGAASKRVTEIKRDCKDTLDDKPTREAVDIPTTKADLIEWLNKHASVVGVEISR
jgi:hypothetical protein